MRYLFLLASDKTNQRQQTMVYINHDSAVHVCLVPICPFGNEGYYSTWEASRLNHHTSKYGR